MRHAVQLGKRKPAGNDLPALYSTENLEGITQRKLHHARIGKRGDEVPEHGAT
jgi:hypothetical protein